jgi:signal transduction histidine kinase
MGMGLSISRSIIEAHEGTLHFNSEPGKGASFYFTLPIQKKT